MLQITTIDIQRDLFGTPSVIKLSGDMNVGIMGDTSFEVVLPSDMKLRFLALIDEIEKRISITT